MDIISRVDPYAFARRSAADFNARRWIPVTKLGRLVKEGRIRSLEVSTGAENEF